MNQFNAYNLALDAYRMGIVERGELPYVPAVSKEHADFVDQAALFGDEVYTAFPSARFDITQAGIPPFVVLLSMATVLAPAAASRMDSMGDERRSLP